MNDAIRDEERVVIVAGSVCLVGGRLKMSFRNKFGMNSVSISCFDAYVSLEAAALDTPWQNLPHESLCLTFKSHTN